MNESATLAHARQALQTMGITTAGLSSAVENTVPETTPTPSAPQSFNHSEQLEKIMQGVTEYFGVARTDII